METMLDCEMRETVSKYLPTSEEIRVLSDFYSVFSDGTRLRLISALSISKMCVTDLAEMLSINQTTCSHQLKELRQTGIVEASRRGKVIIYYLKNPAICDVLLAAVKYLRL